MTCKTPCKNCKCDKACDYLPVDSDLYVEVDDTSFAKVPAYVYNKGAN